MILVLLTLASWRLTRLAVEDTILDRPRKAISEAAGRHERWKLVEFVGCPFCVSVWISAVLTAITARFVSVPVPLLVGTAVAGGAALLFDYRPEHG